VADNSKNQKPKARKAKDEVQEDEIFTAPIILREPTSKQVYLGQKISLRITATGKPLPSFQWYLNGRKISGATSDRYMVNKSRRDQAGAYTCEAKNFVGSSMSRAAMITFLTMKVPELKIAFSSPSTTIITGSPCKISLISPTKDILSKFEFRWVFNGRRIKDANESELSFTAFKPKYSGEYKIVIIHGGEIYSSNIIKLSCLSADTEAQSPVEAPATMEPIKNFEVAAIKVDNFFFDPVEYESASETEPLLQNDVQENLESPSQIPLTEENPTESAKVIRLQKMLSRIETRKMAPFSKAS